MKYAVQMFTLRNFINKPEDWLTAFEKVKKAGYKGVELFGIPELDPETVKEKLDSLGLEPVGCHIYTQSIEDSSTEKTLSYLQKIGCTKVGLAYGASETIEQEDSTLKILANTVEKASDFGIEVYYHNHEKDLEPGPGDDKRFPMDVFGDVAKLELDVYWGYVSKIDVPGYIKDKKGQLLFLHMKNGDGKKTSSLGEGIFDLKPSIEAARETGIEWLIVEDDMAGQKGFESIDKSYSYLLKYAGKQG